MYGDRTLLHWAQGPPVHTVKWLPSRSSIRGFREGRRREQFLLAGSLSDGPSTKIAVKIRAPAKYPLFAPATWAMGRPREPHRLAGYGAISARHHPPRPPIRVDGRNESIFIPHTPPPLFQSHLFIPSHPSRPFVDGTVGHLPRRRKYRDAESTITSNATAPKGWKELSTGCRNDDEAEIPLWFDFATSKHFSIGIPTTDHILPPPFTTFPVPLGEGQCLHHRGNSSKSWCDHQLPRLASDILERRMARPQQAGSGVMKIFPRGKVNEAGVAPVCNKDLSTARCSLCGSDEAALCREHDTHRVSRGDSGPCGIRRLCAGSAAVSREEQRPLALHSLNRSRSISPSEGGALSPAKHESGLRRAEGRGDDCEEGGRNGLVDRTISSGAAVAQWIDIKSEAAVAKRLERFQAGPLTELRHRAGRNTETKLGESLRIQSLYCSAIGCFKNTSTNLTLRSETRRVIDALPQHCQSYALGIIGRRRHIGDADQILDSPFHTTSINLLDLAKNNSHPNEGLLRWSSILNVQEENISALRIPNSKQQRPPRFQHAIMRTRNHGQLSEQRRLSNTSSVSCDSSERQFVDGGETGDSRENPPTNGIVRHDSHVRKSGVNRPVIESGSPSWEASGLNAQPPCHYRNMGMIKRDESKIQPREFISGAAAISHLLMNIQLNGSNCYVSLVRAADLGGPERASEENDRES
ncbi:hypothetical protein PR048_000501 [Dryococelus australis]|uniref:Uncharacterized protein n=1 Tax=Dryococelus australis TaxID=614101 RepID=A0ABQ9IFP6_9NEOP|nr:hypothetical protein PR048_000501 [Dryococelus australis]